MCSASDSIHSESRDKVSVSSDEQITLQVGERRFTTLISTLTGESSFFKTLLSGKWKDPRSDDGVVFVDADPELFEHILRYLRRERLPIIYDQIKGFDLAFYRLLRDEAEFYGVMRLSNWIRNQGFRGAVSVQYTAEVVVAHGADTDRCGAVVDGNTVRSYYPVRDREGISVPKTHIRTPRQPRSLWQSL